MTRWPGVGAAPDCAAVALLPAVAAASVPRPALLGQRIGIALSAKRPASDDTHAPAKSPSGNNCCGHGRVINPTDKPEVPPIRAQLRSSTGRLFYSWTIAPPRGLPPVATRPSTPRSTCRPSATSDHHPGLSKPILLEFDPSQHFPTEPSAPRTTVSPGLGRLALDVRKARRAAGLLSRLGLLTHRRDRVRSARSSGRAGAAVANRASDNTIPPIYAPRPEW